MSSMDIMNKSFETIGLRGEYARFVGDPAPNFAMMVYGKPFRGKSSWSMCFAHELARTIAPVFYWATEEGISKTLQEKIGRLGVAHPRLDFGKKLPSDLSKYRFVFIDSVTDSGLDSKALRELKASHPWIGFVYVFQATKDGKFRGDNTFAHDMDTILNVDDEGIVQAEKRRFGGTGTMPSVKPNPGE